MVKTQQGDVRHYTQETRQHEPIADYISADGEHIVVERGLFKELDLPGGDRYSTNFATRVFSDGEIVANYTEHQISKDAEIPLRLVAEGAKLHRMNVEEIVGRLQEGDFN